MTRERKYKIVESKWINKYGEISIEYIVYKKRFITWEYLGSKNDVKSAHSIIEKEKKIDNLKQQVGQRNLTDEEIFKELL
jgi:hypothetical protein